MQKKGDCPSLFPVWLAVFGLIAAIHLTTVSSEMGGNLGGDNVIYFLLGKALAEGKGYVDLYPPGQPPHLKYPFVFPALLAPFHLALDRPLPAMHALVALCGAAAAVLAGVLAGRRLKRAWAGPVFALLVGTMPSLYDQSGHLLTEPVYMALCLGCLTLVPEEKSLRLRPRLFVGIALLMLAAFFTRSAGLALAGALALSLFRSGARLELGRLKAPAWLVLAAVFGLAAAGWMIRNRLAGGAGMDYLRELAAQNAFRADLGQTSLAGLLSRVGKNLLAYLPYLGRELFAPAWMAPLPLAASLMVGTLIFAMALIGAALELWKGRTAVESFFLLSLSIVIFWPFMESRFLLPILPLACLSLFIFLDRVGRRWGEQTAARVVGAALLLALAGQAIVLAGRIPGRFVDGRDPRAPVEVVGFGQWRDPVIDWAKYDVAAVGLTSEEMTRYRDWLIINRVAGIMAPDGAVAMSRKPMYTYLLSGLPSVPLPATADPERQWDQIRAAQIDYLVMGLNESILNELIKRRPDSFQTIASIPPGSVRLVKIERMDPTRSP